MDETEMLAFADMLLPGDDLFPPASSTTLLGLLVRLPEDLESMLGRLVPLDAQARVARVEKLQADHPKLFAEAQKLVYLAYYEQPAVIAAINGMGIPYHHVLLPEGYDIPPFDPRTDTPRHGRGRWTATQDVARLDLSALPHLTA